ncbi:372_t:CDS:2 [Ambispora gerdemannii]|uniref:Ribosome assembly protein 3 n=1 Tax=Ambispora gerdemannii TaxID=144530 RepID=A0A9N8VRN1_9GLOM|nr:372_t:CDS:2 [Ambispora gerdemannii]
MNNDKELKSQESEEEIDKMEEDNEFDENEDENGNESDDDSKQENLSFDSTEEDAESEDDENQKITPQSAREKIMLKDEEASEPVPLLERSEAAKNFRDFYMNQITAAFGEDLDKIRKEENFDHNRLDILIDSLESNINIFSDIEKELELVTFKQKT